MNPKAIGRHQRLAVRQPDQQIVERDVGCRIVRHRLDGVAGRDQRAAVDDRGFKAVEPRDHRAPFGELPIGADDERQRALHAAEGFGGLDHPAELNLVGEVGGGHQHERKDHGGLREAAGEGRDLLGAAHDAEPVVDHGAEPPKQPFAFRRLALEQRDLFGVLAHAHEVEAEVRFVLLLAEVQPDQRPADGVGQPCSKDRIDQRAPDQIAGNRDFATEHVQRCLRRQAPEDDDKGDQRDDRVEQPEADGQRKIDERFHVIGDALVGVVGGIALQLHPVMVGVAHPFAKIMLGHPFAPADLQPLIEIELIHRDHDKDGDHHGEVDQFVDEVVPVVLLQRVVEAIAPLIEQDADQHGPEFDEDHRREQAPPGPLVLGAKVRSRDPPDGREHQADPIHRLISPGGGVQRFEITVESLDLRLKSHVSWYTSPCPNLY